MKTGYENFKRKDLINQIQDANFIIKNLQKYVTVLEFYDVLFKSRDELKEAQKKGDYTFKRVFKEDSKQVGNYVPYVVDGYIYEVKTIIGNDKDIITYKGKSYKVIIKENT